MSIVERAPSALFIGAGPGSQTEPAPEAGLFEARDIGRILRRRWKLVLVPPLLFLGATLAWLSLMTPQFAASTQILIDPRGLQVVKDGVNPPDQANDASLLLVDSQLRVLTSDEVLKRVVEAFDLERDPEFIGPQSFLDVARARLSALFTRGETAVDPKLTALRALRERTGARRLERSFVVELGVTTGDREKSARIAQANAETYLAAEAETRAGATRRAGGALSGRLDELRNALRDAENQAQAFRAANNIVGTRAQLVSEQQLTQLSDQLGAARARAAEQRARLTQLEALARGAINFDAITEIVQSSTIGQLRGQMAQLEALRADVNQNLGPRHPSVRTAEEQVRSLRGQIDAEVRRITAAVRNEYKAAVANEAALAATLDSRKTEALTVGGNFVRLRELERQVEASRAIYESFLARTRELQEQQRLDTSTSRIISPASPPARRLGPPAMLLLPAALAAGLGLGVLGSFLLEAMAGRVGSPRRLEQATGLPVIGSLPVGRLRALSSGRHSSPTHDIAIARLRHRLRRELPNARPLALVVTSVDDGPGQARLALGLASLAARERERVLLMDADPGGVITRELGLANQRSLADVLEGRVPLLEALAPGPSGFRFLARDRGAAQPDVGVVAAAILAAGEAFDLIVVNAGRVGADATAERLLRISGFSAVLVTASATSSTLEPIRRALEAIGPEPRLRFVVTDLDALA